MYNKFIEHNNMIYSVDMLRIKTFLTYSVFSEIEFRFKTVWKDYVKKEWTTGRAKDFFYNYSIEIEEGRSFYFGFLHNSEKRSQWEDAKYNFTIEFNPNKIKDDKILMYLLNLSCEWYIKGIDLAVDLRVSILDLILDKSGRQKMNIISNGFDDITYRLGKGDGHIKVYNKKIESKLDILGDLTRVEISRTYEDYNISNMKLYKFGEAFPTIYLNQYIYSLSDYKDKTLLALTYAVQHGFSLNDLTRAYKNKLKNLLEGGYRIKFNEATATQVVCQTIYYYFIKNDLMKWR